VESFSKGRFIGSVFSEQPSDGNDRVVLAEVVAMDENENPDIVSRTMYFINNGKYESFSDYMDNDHESRVNYTLDSQGLLKCIQVINCSNVEFIENPAPKMINQKRIKKGKYPLFSFKTLHLNTHSSIKNKSEEGGTHASPRVHMRRGHVRKIEGREIWVQPCVVGDKLQGITHKDYKAH